MVNINEYLCIDIDIKFVGSLIQIIGAHWGNLSCNVPHEFKLHA